MKILGRLIWLGGVICLANSVLEIWPTAIEAGHYLAISWCSIAAGYTVYRSTLIYQTDPHSYFRSYNWVVLFIYLLIIGLLSIQGQLRFF